MPDPSDMQPEEADLAGYRRMSAEDVAEEEDRVVRARFRQAYLIGLMRNEDFRGWLWEWLAEFGTFGNPMAVSPTGFPDPMATQFFLGKKAAGWAMWEQFDNLAPELASLMRREGSKPKDAPRVLPPPERVGR